MSTDITKFNLDKDKKVQGENWFKTYNGYFSDTENIENFIGTILPYLPKYPLEILYVASASGVVGEALLDKLGQGNLTLVDISEEHLRLNTNPKTKKVLADLLEFDLGLKFDLIIMRSSLDYFPSKKEQVRVLSNIKKHLKLGGLFVNQPAYIPNIIERDHISEAYVTVEKIGNRFFQSEDIGELYEEAGFSKPKKIGDGKLLELSEREHSERYRIDEVDTEKIRSCISSCSTFAGTTETGYFMRFEFPIFITEYQT